MLCGKCRSLNLCPRDFIIQANEDQDSFNDFHELGSLQLIREKSNLCQLCHLIVEIIGGSHIHFFSQQDKDIQCQLYWGEDGFFRGGDGPKVRFLSVSAQPLPPPLNEFNRLIPLADDLPDLEGLFFGRKIKDASINVKRIKKWMKLCQKWHGEDCEQLSASLDWEFPSNFRLIDAWDRCIVQAPPGCKFLVLSYVWGPLKVFKLLKDNLCELQVKGALNKVWQDLSRTIQDAITLTSSLSIRHIWIDSLCIVQDEWRDKNSLIPYMHIIYDRAFMTILAATGEDAQAGLPGVGPKPRAQQQRFEEISPGLRLICPKHIVDALNQTVYESRAWTYVIQAIKSFMTSLNVSLVQRYQESCLSRRALIFLESLVMFRCRCGLWREDVCLENIEVENSFDMTFKHSISGSTAAGDPHSDYAGSLYEYSSRRLTYDSDILNAFSGILGILCGRMSNGRNPEVDHVYGLPTYIFDWAILWQPNTSVHRRTGGWPSWSWCGWTGTTSMALSGMNVSQLENWLCKYTWIKWTMYDRNGQLLMQIPSESTYQREKQGDVRFQHLTNHTPISPASAPKVEALMAFSTSTPSPLTTITCSHLLHFTTLSLFLHLTSTSQVVHDAASSPSSSGSSRLFYMIHHHVTSQTSIPCGTIWLNTTWHYDAKPQRTYEFLVISAAPRNSVMIGEFQPKELKSRTEAEVGAEMTAYFVMLIERDSSNEEVAERVGLGAVYGEAIDMALSESGSSGAQWKEIWLR